MGLQSRDWDSSADNVGYFIGDSERPFHHRFKLFANFDVFPIPRVGASDFLGKNFPFNLLQLFVGPGMRQFNVSMLFLLAGLCPGEMYPPPAIPGDQISVLVPILILKMI